MNDSAMTEKQREVFDQVQELLTEHFDGHIFSARVDYAESDSNDGITVGGFGGGASAAIGLCKIQEARLIRITMKDFDNEH